MLMLFNRDPGNVCFGNNGEIIEFIKVKEKYHNVSKLEENEALLYCRFLKSHHSKECGFDFLSYVRH